MENLDALRETWGKAHREHWQVILASPIGQLEKQFEFAGQFGQEFHIKPLDLFKELTTPERIVAEAEVKEREYHRVKDSVESLEKQLIGSATMRTKKWANLEPRQLDKDAMVIASEASDWLPTVPRYHTIEQITKDIEIIAPTDDSVLLLGETGTGKEFYAETIHDRWVKRNSSKRPSFTIINCPLMSEARAESELFGHVKGAFTGAERDYSGQLKVANGGSVFFDEFGDLPETVWPHLLRFLETKQIRPAGSEKAPLRIEVRIIAATSKPSTIPIDIRNRFDHVLYLPPLRVRSDMVSLCGSLFSAAKKERNKTSLRFTDVERRKLLKNAFEWPGNIRQLRKAIRNAVLKHQGKRDLLAEEVLLAAREIYNPE